jgi:2-dehydropantoate 2-reductase
MTINLSRNNGAAAPTSDDTWHVLGAGSLGGLWAARLHRAGFQVRLILRDADALDAYERAGGLALVEQSKTQHYEVPACALADCNSIRRLVLASKAYDAEPAAHSLEPLIQPGADVLLLQNGLGSQQAVARVLSAARCLAVSSTEGAFRSAPFHIHAAGTGQNWIGDLLNPRSQPPWLPQLKTAAIPYIWSEDIESRLWKKLGLNCAINPLSVLYDCSNGALLSHLAQVEIICEELGLLLIASGLEDSAGGLLSETVQVIESTAGNISSMLQDVRAGRRTEVRYLLGHACATAIHLNVPTPALHALHEQLRQHLAKRGLPLD